MTFPFFSSVLFFPLRHFSEVYKVDFRFMTIKACLKKKFQLSNLTERINDKESFQEGRKKLFFIFFREKK
jgi:hypothetical protein